MSVPPPPPANRARFFAVFPSIMLPMFLGIVDQTIVATALPAIAGELGHVDQISWVVISYLIAVTIAAPVYGRLGDLLGRRRLMFIALAIMIAASVACAFAPSIAMLSAARIIQGFGGGGLQTLSQSMVADAVAPRERARFQGYLSAIGVTSNSFGPVAGGFLTEHFGWRSVFLVNVPLGLLAILLTFRIPAHIAVRESFRLDVLGLLLFAGFVAVTLFMLQELQELAVSPAAFLFMLALSVASAALFVWNESRASHPLIPLAVLRVPTIWRCGAIAALHGAILVALITFSPIYFRIVHGISPAETGLLILPMTGGLGIGSLITGRLVSATGRTAIFPSCGLLLVTVMLGFLGMFVQSLSAGEIAASLAIMSLLLGTVMGVVQVLILAAGPTMFGTVIGTVQFSRALGAAFGTAIAGVILFMSVRTVDPDAAMRLTALLQSSPDFPASDSFRAEISGAFRPVFLTLAAFSLLASALAFTVPIRRI